jgi:uncharacterized protein (TIGR03437 family)
LSKLAVALCALASGAAWGQTINAIVNSASNVNASFPNGGLAQGSIAVAYGAGIGPPALEIVSSFPLPRSLGGTSVRIAAGGGDIEAIMIYTSARQVAFIVPSAAPLGNAAVTIAFNGRSTAPFSVRIVATAVGVYALNQGGSGPGVFTDANFAVNTLVRPARGGGVWVAWATGIGRVAGDEAGGPLPGDLTGLNVVVLVGGRRANVTYRGRSGCCAGVDQIAFEIPETVAGCYVPVTISVNGVPSNTVTMSIAPGAGPCEDANGLTPADLSAAEARGVVSRGVVTLMQTSLAIEVPLLGSIDTRTDTGVAAFGRQTFADFLAAQSLTGISAVGACFVYSFEGLIPLNADPVTFEPLDAGRITVTGPAGTRELTRTAAGLYSETLGGGGQSLPGFPGGGTPFLEAGNYTVAGAGGEQIGAFNAAFSVPSLIRWLNKQAVVSVSRNQGVTVNWSGGGGGDIVEILGASALPSVGFGAAFLCRERASAGTFTVPPEVTRALPASENFLGVPAGTLAVGGGPPPARFMAAGLDFGFVNFVTQDGKVLAFQ